MRLLLVEDEDAIRTALQRGLSHNGNHVVAAASLIEARNAAKTHLPDALLSDFKLPDGSGLDLASELGIPFLMMSGYASFDDAVQAMRMGCVDFFTKPVSIKDLRRGLERLFGRLRVDALQAVIPDGQPGRFRIVRPSGLGMVDQPLSTQAWTWNSREEAMSRFAEAAAQLPASIERQVVAELLQAAPSGRLVLNISDDWWVAWLEATVDWHGAEDERRRLIEECSERCVWRPDGALVECSHE